MNLIYRAPITVLTYECQCMNGYENGGLETRLLPTGIQITFWTNGRNVVYFKNLNEAAYIKTLGYLTQEEIMHIIEKVK